MNFKDGIDRIETIDKDPDTIVVWNNSTGWLIKKDDLDTFCTHMDNFYSVSCKALTRQMYEDICKKLNINTTPDNEIGGYGVSFGDYGMGHYHTNPANRIAGLTGALLQSRWYGMIKEDPDLPHKREKAEKERIETLRLNTLRATYPSNLNKWIEDVGGLEAIYTKAKKIHENNSSILRETGRHFEWLIGHTCKHLGMDASKNHPDYVAPKNAMDYGVYPLFPKWWGGWNEKDEQHPINRIAAMLFDKRIEPYMGKITYIGYGEDCEDDVRKNAKEWLGMDL